MSVSAWQHRFIWSVLALLTSCVASQQHSNLPAGFVSISSVAPDIQLDIRYYTNNNFIGRPIEGYFAPLCILTIEAASALARVQRLAEDQGYSLKVYDCYRPQIAVNDFVAWAADLDDTLQQHRFYPALDKSRLFAEGYIAERSGHSRGSTVDLTLVPLGSQQPAIDPFANRYDCRAARFGRYPDNSIDMGSGYDCFDSLANTANEEISDTARNNRELLSTLMAMAGFENYPLEWWHFTLMHEPYPDTYFEFPVGE